MAQKRTISLRELKQFKKRISKQIPIEKMILFGSAAEKRLGKHSDIDILLVSKKFEGMEYEERGPPIYHLWTINRPFDLICLTPREIQQRKRNHALVAEALRKGVDV